MELRSEEIKKVYKDRMVVKGVNIHVKSGEIVGLLGPNGAGKTTSFYMMVGFIRPTSGQVFIDNDDVTSLPMFQRARHGLGYLAQEPTIFKGLTVEENVGFGLDIKGVEKSKANDLAFLLKAKEQSKARMKQNPTPDNISAFRRARAAVEEESRRIQGGSTAMKIFKTQLDACTFLRDSGFKISKSAFTASESCLYGVSELPSRNDLSGLN